jgi:ADP-ribose pyrophosphatase
MEKTLDRKVVYSGRAVKLELLDIDLGNGKTSQREIIRHPGAVVVLAERPDGKFIFVRQYRKAIEQALLETVAGTLEPGELPEDCARRELQEESGYTATSMQPLGKIVPAPGYSAEKLYLFYAETPITPGEQNPDEDERIDVLLLDKEEIEAAIDAGRLIDAKTLSIWFLYTRRAANA